SQASRHVSVEGSQPWVPSQVWTTVPSHVSTEWKSVEQVPGHVSEPPEPTKSRPPAPPLPLPGPDAPLDEPVDPVAPPPASQAPANTNIKPTTMSPLTATPS